MRGDRAGPPPRRRAGPARVDLHAEMLEYTLRVVGRALFGASMDEAIPVVRATFPVVNEDVRRRAVAAGGARLGPDLPARRARDHRHRADLHAAPARPPPGRAAAPARGARRRPRRPGPRPPRTWPGSPTPRWWSRRPRLYPSAYAFGRRSTAGDHVGGPGVCIGNHFALAEAVVATAVLLAGHRLHADPGPVPLSTAVTLRPARPVHCEVAPRRPAAPAATALGAYPASGGPA